MGGVRILQQAVILAPNWLGDAVMCLPAVAALQAAHPECAWRVWARPSVAPVFRLARLGLVVEELRPSPSLWVPRGGAELAVIFPNSFYAALLARRMGAARRVGYARDRRRWLLRPAIAAPPAGTIGAHESFYYLELARQAGLIAALPAGEPRDFRVALRPDAAAVAEWRQRLGTGQIIAMHVGASFGTAKRWLPERFAELARAWADRDATVVLVGSAAEREVARQVRIQASRSHRIKNMAGETTLEQLAALLGAVDLLVANDSGPMHLAAAVGTRVVALFGSTNERETYPLAEAGKLQLVKVPGIACSPCKLRECPIDHRCMTRLEVETVMRACERVIRDS